MIDFILEYWIHALFGAIIAIIGAMYRKLMNKLKEQSEIKSGMLAILQDRLFQGCTHFIRKGYIDIEEMKILDSLYESYKQLGGNGVGTTLYGRVKELPIKEEGG